MRALGARERDEWYRPAHDEGFVLLAVPSKLAVVQSCLVLSVQHTRGLGDRICLPAHAPSGRAAMGRAASRPGWGGSSQNEAQRGKRRAMTWGAGTTNPHRVRLLFGRVIVQRGRGGVTHQGPRSDRV